MDCTYNFKKQNHSEPISYGTGIDCRLVKESLMVEGGVLNINIPVSHIPSCCWMSLSFTGVRTTS